MGIPGGVWGVFQCVQGISQATRQRHVQGEAKDKLRKEGAKVRNAEGREQGFEQRKFEKKCK